MKRSAFIIVFERARFMFSIDMKELFVNMLTIVPANQIYALMLEGRKRAESRNLRFRHWASIVLIWNGCRRKQSRIGAV